MRALTIKERHGQPDDSVEEVVVKLAGGTDCIQSPLQCAGQHNQRAQQSHHSVTCSSHTTTQQRGPSNAWDRMVVEQQVKSRARGRLRPYMTV